MLWTQVGEREPDPSACAVATPRARTSTTIKGSAKQSGVPPAC
jgi:hypothetical protein